MHSFRFGASVVLAALSLSLACALHASAAEPITLAVDTSKLPNQHVVSVHETIPAKPGAMTIVYPKWIPGAHSPDGPIGDVASLIVHANGAVVPWDRDDVDMYAFHMNVPAGASKVDVDFTYLASAKSRLSAPNLSALEWNEVVMYPQGAAAHDTIVKPSIVLSDASWHFGTALPDPQQSGATVSFDPVSLETLVDSPFFQGANYRKFALLDENGFTNEIDAFADTPEELDASPETVRKLKNLVREMDALYGARHWRHYHFLLTLSDVIPGEGLEHHESSDDGTVGNFLTDDQAFQMHGDLLSHEFNHSWDGKYRRPAGLATANYQDPMKGELLWVYEGMTQYYGNVVSFRDGVRPQTAWSDHVASVYANYDTEPGRLWRPLVDTARGVQFSYGANREYYAERRGADYYSEGELMWLDVDSIIREKSNGQKSLDDMARAFFGRENTPPMVVPYTFDDIVAALNAVQPYDWASYLREKVYTVQQHPPAGFERDGWKLVYTDQPQTYVKKNNLRYSLGMTVGDDGAVSDVLFGSPAWNASLGAGSKIVAVNDRTFSIDTLVNALKESKASNKPVRLLMSAGDTYRTVSIDYHGGPRYPHLVRMDNTTDRLSDVAKPRRKE